MIAQARAELPNECCGLLAGHIVDGQGVVETRYPLRNDLADPTEFNADPRDLLAAHKDMRRRGLDLLAIYHSHPTSAAIPSRKDCERSYSDEVMSLIIGLPDSTVRAWWLTESGYREADWGIVE